MILAVLLPEGYWKKVTVRLMEHGVDLLIVLALYLLLRWLIVHVSARIIRPVAGLQDDPVRTRRLKTLSELVRSTLLYVLALVSAIMALRAIGVDPVPLITAAGVAGLAIGFGAQKLVRDVINGFFILLENQFAVGEIVTISGTTGTVCEVGLRTTRLLDSQGKLFIFSNGDITSVCNHSRNELIVPLEVSVSAQTDLRTACEALDKAAAEVSRRFGLSQPYACQGVASFDATKVTLKVVGRVPSTRQDAFLRDLRQEILTELQKESIALV